MFVKIDPETNEVATYPYSPEMLVEANSSISLPRIPTDAQLAEFNVYPVSLMEKPTSITKNYTEVNPVLTNGIWIQTYQESNASQAEIDARTAAANEAARLAAIDSAIVGDTVVNLIKAMTSAEYDTWWSANVSNANQAITVLKRVVRIVARRL